MAVYHWNGPYDTRKYGRFVQPWWADWREGISLVRNDAGVWSEVRTVTDEQLSSYSAVLRGGYDYTSVSQTHYDELVAQGYSEYFI